MSKIFVAMGSREYYSGDITIDLPWGISEEDIQAVEPHGYGDFIIWLNDEGKNRVEIIRSIQDVVFTGELIYTWYKEARIDDEWLLLLDTQGNYGIKLSYELHMEFCEVDENMVDHWEVKEEDNGCTETGDDECRGLCPRCCPRDSS